MALSEERAALESLITFTASIKQTFAMPGMSLSANPSALRSQHSMIPDLDLAYPHDQLIPIKLLTISQKAKASILRCIHRRISELQQNYVLAYHRACQAALQIPFLATDIQTVKLTFQALFGRNCLPHVKVWVSLVVSKAAKCAPPPVTHNGKRRFRSEYTSFLEEYFRTNAYPPPAHQSVLARRTGMEYQQIAVWFQNHRNRAKKEGQPRNKHSADLALKRALKMLRDGNMVTSDDPVGDANLFSHRPAHAFPTVFAESRRLPDPFRDENGVYKLAPTVWPRKSRDNTPTTQPSAESVDMEELARMFRMKLSFSERKRRSTPSDQRDSSPWYSSTLVVPPNGAHPASTRKVVVPSTILPRSCARLGFPAGSMHPVNHSPFHAFVGDKLLPLFDPSFTPDQDAIPAWKTASRITSYSSDASLENLSSSLSSSDSSPEPSTPPQLPQQDATLQLQEESSIPLLPEQDVSVQPLEFNPDEFAPDKFDFTVFDYDFGLINHPDIPAIDYNPMSPIVRHITLPDQHMPITTVDPSQLILSNITHPYPNYLAACS